MVVHLQRRYTVSIFDTTVRAPRTRDEQRQRIERLIERRHMLRPTEESIRRATGLLYTWEHVAAMAGVTSLVLDHLEDFPALALESCYVTAPGQEMPINWPPQDETERVVSGQVDKPLK